MSDRGRKPSIYSIVLCAIWGNKQVGKAPPKDTTVAAIQWWPTLSFHLTACFPPHPPPTAMLAYTRTDRPKLVTLFRQC